jgi:hypothetical protein
MKKRVGVFSLVPNPLLLPTNP